MKILFGQRIKSARIMAGLSLRELSNLLEGLVSHNAISKYERGEMLPDSKILIALAKVLNVKTDYFLRSSKVEITNIEFRKKAGLTVRNCSSIKEIVKDCMERYLEIESFLLFEQSFFNPLVAMVNSVEEVEDAVEKLLVKWNLGTNALPNVLEMLEDNDIKVVEIEVNEKFDGLSGWANQVIPFIVVNKNHSVERKRFTALHELGHLLLNINSALNQKEKELLCHRFAGAMLLPQKTIFQELGKKRSSISINELIFVKETYGISIQAIMARAKDLNIISNDQYVRFRIRVNQNNMLKSEIGFGHYNGVEYTSRFMQLIYRATAEEIITMSKAASLSNMKLAQFRDTFMSI